MYLPTLPEDLEVLSIEVFSEDNYQYRITNTGSETFDRNFAVFSLDEYSKELSSVSSMKKLSFNEGTKNIEVFYSQQQNYVKFYIFVSDNEVCYYYQDRTEQLPSDEWFLSFGVEKYVGK